MRYPHVDTVKSRRWAAGLLVVVGLAAYAGSFAGEFVLDDSSSISANPTIRRLWPLWDVLVTPRANVTAQGRPLLNLSLALNYAISGEEVWSYHAFNLAVHLMAALALFGIVRRTIALRPMAFGSPCEFLTPTQGQTARTPIATWLGFIVALLWMVHPLQTESVTYIVQRAESLMGLFYLLTLYCFIRYSIVDPDARPRAVWGVLAVLACLAGMATKEVMVTAPVMVLLYDRVFVARSWQMIWERRRAFHAGLAATWFLLGLCLLRGGGNRGGAIGFGTGVSWWDYGLTQFEAIGRYLALSLWPHPLVFEYGAFTVRHARQVLPWAIPVVSLLAATVWAFRRYPAVGFLGGWFFIILAPTSLMPGTSQMIVEHRAYLPLAAILALLVCGGYIITARSSPAPIVPSEDRMNPVPPFSSDGAGKSRPVSLFLAFTLCAATALATITAQRNRSYRSALSLWADTVMRRPANPLAHHLLADELSKGGRNDDALSHYRQAVRLDPGFALAHEKLGELLMRAGKSAEAAGHLQEASRLAPDFADPHNNYGALLAAERRTTEAIAHLQKALAIAPDYSDAHYNLANLMAAQGRYEEALGHYTRALRLKPDFAGAHFNLANTLATLGRTAEAIREYDEALRLKPNFPAAEFNLANTLARVSRLTEAADHYRKALRLKPDFAAAEMNLGSALFDLGRVAEAETHYLAALRLDPSLPGIEENLARMRAANDRLPSLRP